MNKTLPLICSQFELTQIFAEVKSYDASWREGSQKVYREGGRFAKSSGSGETEADEPQSLVSMAVEGLKQIRDNVIAAIQELSQNVHDAIEIVLNSPQIRKVKERLSKTQDAVSEVTFEKVSDVLLNKKEKTFKERMSEATDVAIAHLQATATSPVPVIKGVLGAFLIPFFAGAILAASATNSNNPDVDKALKVLNTTPNIALGLLGVRLMADSIQEIEAKSKKILSEREKSQFANFVEQVKKIA